MRALKILSLTALVLAVLVAILIVSIDKIVVSALEKNYGLDIN